jgi:hypothetical protein
VNVSTSFHLRPSDQVTWREYESETIGRYVSVVIDNTPLYPSTAAQCEVIAAAFIAAGAALREIERTPRP